MRTIRLYYPDLSQKQPGNKFALLDPLDIQHLKVLRVGDAEYNFEVGDGQGLLATAEFVKLTKEGGLFTLTEFINSDRNPVINTLLLPIIRPANLEIAVDQAAQLDLYQQIYLYFPDHTHLKENKYSDNKLIRLKKIAMEAYKQSHAVYLPEIILLDNLKTAVEIAIDQNPDTSVIVPDTKAESMEINSVKKDEGFTLVIGAEGGFSEKERSYLSSLKNTTFFSFGTSTLTTETASTVFGGLLKVTVTD